MVDYWRYRPLAPLASALGLTGDYRELRFEQKFPTGLKGKRPNLDLTLFQPLGPPAGIECRFCEPYDATEMQEPLDAVYLTAGNDRWTEVGMPSAQLVAEALGYSFRPIHLAAGQLLKHLLGLGHTFADLRPVQLVYLWFDNGSATANIHRQELAEFSSLIKPDVTFLSLTYQDLFLRLQRCEDVEARYLSELRERYFVSENTPIAPAR